MPTVSSLLRTTLAVAMACMLTCHLAAQAGAGLRDWYQ